MYVHINIRKQFLCNSTLKIGGRGTLGNKIAKMIWCLGVLYSIIHVISDEKQFCFVFYFCGCLQNQTNQFQKAAGRETGKSFHSKPLLQVDTLHFSCCQHITSSHRLIAVLPVAPHCLMWKAAATSNVTLNTDCLLTCTALHRSAQNTYTFFGRDDTPMFWQRETTRPWQSPGEQNSTWEHLVAMKNQRVLGCFLRVQWFGSYRQAATFRIAVCHRIWYWRSVRGSWITCWMKSLSYLTVKALSLFAVWLLRGNNFNLTGEPMLNIIIHDYLLLGLMWKQQWAILCIKVRMNYHQLIDYAFSLPYSVFLTLQYLFKMVAWCLSVQLLQKKKSGVHMNADCGGAKEDAQDRSMCAC